MREEWNREKVAEVLTLDGREFHVVGATHENDDSPCFTVLTLGTSTKHSHRI